MSPLLKRGHVRALQIALAKLRIWSLFQAPQRVFEITPLVPGSPSLDVRPHSPGGTRRSGDCRFKIADVRFIGARHTGLTRLRSQIGNRKSKIKICQSVTVVLKCQKPSRKTRPQPQIPMPNLLPNRSKPVTDIP